MFNIAKMNQYHLLIPLSTLIITIFQGCFSNICEESNVSNLDDVLYMSATPRGGVSAGLYNKDPNSHKLLDCLYSCCDRGDCNVVFFHDDTCFLITCNKTHPEACEPEKRSGRKFSSTYMIQVRTPEETSSAAKYDEITDTLSDDLDLSHTPDISNLQVQNECDPHDVNSCDFNEDCQLMLSENAVGYMCQCTEDYLEDPDTGRCIKDIPYTTSADVNDFAVGQDDSCTLGLLHECRHNEECVEQSSQSHVGVCQCLPGFSRHASSGFCEPHTEESFPQQHFNISVSHVSPVKKENSGSLQINSTASPSSSSSTMSPTELQAGTTKPAHLPVEKLVVSAGESKVIQIPHNDVTLSAYVVPKDDRGEYKYEWSQIAHPEGDQIGQMVGMNTATLQLSKLIAGLYTFKVIVSAEGKYGEALINVTVLPPTRQNEPPVSVIKPQDQQVNQPNDVVLDGSQSTDDDKIISYRWELVSGPLSSQSINQEDFQSPMVVLKGLGPGKYRIKLTVTDSDGVENSTFANVTVIKEVNYPPKANAGSNVIISLPQNSVVLYGNASTDDKGIVSYEWIKKSDDMIADMTGVRTPFLHLSKLEDGDYTFTLKVTDTAGQTSTADVHVFVKPELNKPPVANAGKDSVYWLPINTITLDGTNSTDDQKIEKYTWSQVSGPETVVIENADRAVATLGHLAIGTYKFKLIVADVDDLQASAYVTINIKENRNKAPVSNAGGDQILDLPLTVVYVNGSKSTDDNGIVSYQWTRTDKSLAAGEIVNGSSHRAVLQLVRLVEGRYMFTLEVKDAGGLSNKDTATIIVRPDVHHNDLVEIHLDADIRSFLEVNKHNLENQISLLLHHTPETEDIQMVIRHISQESGQLVVQFYVTRKDPNDQSSILPGREVVSKLKQKLKADNDVMDFRVLSVDTVVCQNNCSGHGHCDPTSKKCVCEAFWMENFIQIHLGYDSNCDWSILYVIIVVFVSIITISSIIWAVVCACSRWYRWRPKKRHRYTLLEELDEEQKDNTEMLPRGKIQNSSLMVSESDFSSDEQTIFINTKKTNGHVKNGLIKPERNKVKT